MALTEEKSRFHGIFLYFVLLLPSATCNTCILECIGIVFHFDVKCFANVEVELVGERPCMKDVDPEAQARLTQKCIAVQSRIINQEVRTGSGSTDCNIPHSLGIPAVAMGICSWHGIHTREEYIEKASLPTGLEIALRVMCALAKKA